MLNDDLHLEVEFTWEQQPEQGGGVWKVEAKTRCGPHEFVVGRFVEAWDSRHHPKPPPDQCRGVEKEARWQLEGMVTRAK